MPGLFELSGSQSLKQAFSAPLFIESFWNGLFTNRSALQDPSSLYERKYLGGRPGSMLGGLNTEVSVRNTVIRRYGVSSFSTATYPSPPNRGFNFEDTNGVIRVLIDTGSTGSLTVTAAANTSGGNTVYTGVFPAGGANAYVGMTFLIAGFVTNTINNGTFVCTASTTTTLTLANTQGVAETHAATAVSSGAVYFDEQNGSKILLKSKQPGAGQTNIVPVAGIAYAGDGVETWIYTPNNPNGTTWGWGLDAPTAPPGITIVSSGASATVWKALTNFTTMGLVEDAANNAVYQLISVNTSGTNTTEFGTSGSGQIAWNVAGPGSNTTDNSITWFNNGPIVLWTPNTVYNNATPPPGGTNTNPCIIYDPITKACYININSGRQPGTSGTVKPNFKPGFNQSTHDPGPNGGVKWYWIGLPGTWQKSTAYPAIGTDGDVGTSVVEPTSLANGLPTGPGAPTIYWQTSSGGTSASSATSPFNATTNAFGTINTPDGDLAWLSLGSDVWAPQTPYTQWTANLTAFSAIHDSNNNFQVCISGGTSDTVVPGTSFTLSAASNASGGNTTYTISGSPTVPAFAPGQNVVITGFTNSVNNGTFQIVSMNSTTLVVKNASGVAESHTGAAVYNPWGTTYGAVTVDGSVTWTCVGSVLTWAASTQWCLPTPGFSPPTQSNPYGGASVVDSNNNVEFVYNSGKSGSSAPSWLTSTLSMTTDSGVTWINIEPYSAQSLSWTSGYAYAYSFKSRSLLDFYSVLSDGAYPVPPGVASALQNPPPGSLTGDISSASPAAIITGPNTGAVNTITGFGSTNPAVDTIVIWRSADGGGPGQMYELTEINAPQPINGIAQPWTFKDFLPDTPTADFPGLNPLIPAPIDDANDPPISTLIPMDYNFSRIWGASGQYVYFSQGPDNIISNPNSTFAPGDYFIFLSNVVRAAKITQGLVVYTKNSVEMIQGGPATASFYSITLGPGVGLGNFNGMDFFLGEQHFIDTNGLLRTVSPTLSVSSIGFPILDQLITLDPTKVYLTYFDGPNDSALFIGTGGATYGGNTGWFRCNPRQTPGGPNGPEPAWSPFAAIGTGCQMLQSVEISAGVKKLLVGSNLSGQEIMKRDTTVYTDNGTQYDAYFILGNIWFAHRGEIAFLNFINLDLALVTTAPTLSYLLNEISGSFTPFATSAPVNDPPSIYGATLAPSSYNSLRYYFASNASLARCVHAQIKVDFGTTSNADEIFDMTIYGGITKGM